MKSIKQTENHSDFNVLLLRHDAHSVNSLEMRPLRFLSNTLVPHTLLIFDSFLQVYITAIDWWNSFKKAHNRYWCKIKRKITSLILNKIPKLTFVTLYFNL